MAKRKKITPFEVGRRGFNTTIAALAAPIAITVGAAILAKKLKIPLAKARRAMASEVKRRIKSAIKGKF